MAAYAGRVINLPNNYDWWFNVPWYEVKIIDVRTNPGAGMKYTFQERSKRVWEAEATGTIVGEAMRIGLKKGDFCCLKFEKRPIVENDIHIPIDIKVKLRETGLFTERGQQASVSS